MKGRARDVVVTIVAAAWWVLYVIGIRWVTRGPMP